MQNYAISLNPTDAKARSGWYGPSGKQKEAKIGGRDASGVVVAVGEKASGLSVGDEVFYAGDTTRQGTYQQYTLVDSRLVGKKPKSLNWLQAASLPLTSITVWEAIFEDAKPQAGQKILIYSAAGGVGSIAIQLAKHWSLHVTATASRPETQKWVKELGADVVLDHHKPLKDQIKESDYFDLALNCSDESHWNSIVAVLKPRAKLACILPVKAKTEDLPYGDIFFKRIHVIFEMMFSRPALGYEQEEQGKLLNEISKLVDEKKIRHTAVNEFEWKDFHKAQELLESGKSIGKNVVSVPH